MFFLLSAIAALVFALWSLAQRQQLKGGKSLLSVLPDKKTAEPQQNNETSIFPSLDLMSSSSILDAVLENAGMPSLSTSGKRGIRNNNPGNIRITGDNWQGLLPQQNDPSFFQFTHAKYGIRAMAKILSNYQAQGVGTIAQIISRWAPATENNTQSYINHVSQLTGWPSFYTPSKAAGDYLPLIKAIIKHENGEQPYSDALIKEAIAIS